MVYFLNQVYVPAVMVVVISWIPFWLNRDDSIARIGLGVTTVLTQTTLVTQTNANMPHISYMKSIDIYLEVCYAMVFLALIEYAIIGYLSHKTNNKVMDSEIRFGLVSVKCKAIDCNSRWIFPTVFVIFNIWYWIEYLVF